MIIGLRHIKRIEKDRKDGLAVLYPDNDGMRIYCKESYEQERHYQLMRVGMRAAAALTLRQVQGTRNRLTPTRSDLPHLCRSDED